MNTLIVFYAENKKTCKKRAISLTENYGCDKLKIRNVSGTRTDEAVKCRKKIL